MIKARGFRRINNILCSVHPVYIFYRMTENSPLILIYFKFRGQLQPIRNLLCYLQVPFVEVHPEFLEEEKLTLSPKVREQLKGARIDKNRLPLLFFEGYTVYQPFPILTFIVRRFQREDLLGTNPQQKARLMQILDIYFMRQPQCMNELSRLSDMAATTNPELMQLELRKSYEMVMNRSGYIRQMCEFLDCQLNPRYILSSRMTIADFLFLETCNYVLGLYNNTDKWKLEWKEGEDKKIGAVMARSVLEQDNYQTGKKPNLYYLRIMREYRQRIQSHTFYQRNAHFLESFSIISLFTSQERAQGLKKIWQLDDYFIK